ncbi:tail fiber domain-containing protein [Luminiphilus sp.]|nr:tail fiber domain-containing protein [Luminiphilus sp.]
MTKVILATFFLVFTSNAISQAITVTNTFVDGQTASAAEVNQNFTDLINGVDAIVRSDDALSNTATGAFALLNNTTGGFNTASGYQALSSNTEGESNTASGYAALYTNTTGIRNTASGVFALFNNITGNDNTAVGRAALYNNTEGFTNTASGMDALFANTTGSQNTASGYRALYNNITGINNTASGHAALFSNTAGNNNTAHGTEAMQANTLGSNNTAIGTLALSSNVSGSGHIAIGYRADVGSPDLTNVVVIGNGATVQASNTVRLGNAAIEEVRTSGTFFSSGSAITSDERLKEGVVAVTEGLALVNDLNPVSYHRINNKSDDIEMGLLAQEVEETLAAHGLRNSGMVQQASEDAYRTVRYNDLLAPMIRAIQELDDQHNVAITLKDEQTASLQEQLTEQQGSLLAMIATQQEQIVQLQNMVNQQFATR